MNKFIILGIQGSGKGTQATMMQRNLHIVHISVGDIFRWNIQHHTKLGARIRRFVAKGLLVPDEMVEEVVRARLEQHDWNFGFVLDGFPRNDKQAEFLFETYDIDAVIQIEVPKDDVFKRILARRLCVACGLDYNLIQHRPMDPDRCDICNGPLITREEDSPAVIRGRMAEYEARTQPLLEMFRGKVRVVEVDGSRVPDEVQAEIRQKLQLSVRQPAVV